MLFLIDDICNIPLYPPKQIINRLKSRRLLKNTIWIYFDGIWQCVLTKIIKDMHCNKYNWKLYLYSICIGILKKNPMTSFDTWFEYYATSFAPEAKNSSLVSVQRLNLIVWSGVLYSFSGAAWQLSIILIHSWRCLVCFNCQHFGSWPHPWLWLSCLCVNATIRVKT